jgi:pimeloyl-ACP methyl ester carboxylesterase
VRFFEEVRDALGLGPVTVMGHSWGGLIAVLFAAMFPESVRRCIVVDGYAGDGSVFQTFLYRNRSERLIVRAITKVSTGLGKRCSRSSRLATGADGSRLHQRRRWIMAASSFASLLRAALASPTEQPPNTPRFGKHCWNPLVRTRHLSDTRFYLIDRSGRE